MFLRLLALFIIVPVIEMIALIFIGSWLGAIQTTLIIVITAVVGAWLTRREGLGVIEKLKRDLAKGMPPASHIAEGLLILAGGLLLLTPGVFTDICGFLLTIPWTRKRIAPALIRALSRHFLPSDEQSSKWRVAFDAKISTPEKESTKSPAKPFDHPVA